MNVPAYLVSFSLDYAVRASRESGADARYPTLRSWRPRRQQRRIQPQHQMPPRRDAGTTRVFRLFVSSTFSDFRRERTALQSLVYPELRKLCAAHGCRFLAVDLRWGVPTEASLDQQAVRICLEEIRRCQEVTPRPNFLALIGDRYGWRPLPSALGQEQWASLARGARDHGGRDLLERWYHIDRNAVPAVYELQRRKGASVDAVRWDKIERRLREIIERATDADTSAGQRSAGGLPSVTEQEIGAGIFGSRSSAGCAVAVIRNLQLPDTSIDVVLGRNDAGWFDLDPDGTVDRQAHERQRLLRERVRKSVRRPLAYDVSPARGGATKDQLKAMCQDVAGRLSDVISSQLEALETLGAFGEEKTRHRAFAESSARSLIGRRTELRRLAGYIRARGRNASPFVLEGVPGSGKSTLMGSAMQEALSRAGQVVVGRFVGVTPESRNERVLLEGICREIASHYDHRLPRAFGTFPELLEAFAHCLTLASQKRPLVLLVDALDQMDATPGLAELRWIPPQLPPGVRMVLSTLSGPRREMLRARLPAAADGMSLTPLDPKDGRRMLDQWLSQGNRTLTASQRGHVLGQFARCAWPLYLRLAANEAMRWKSSDAPGHLARSVHGLLLDLFERLSLPTNHGRQLVERSLAYLAAAREGLSEDELVELLERDIDVMREFRGRSTFNRTVDHLPPLIWSRLFFDLRPLLTEVGDRQAPLLGFWHSQVREAVDRGWRSRATHRRLAQYFSEPGRKWHSPNGAPDSRRVVELPFHQIQAGQWAAAARTLSDFDFLAARCERGSVHDLDGDFRLALSRWPRREANGSLVAAFEEAVRAEAHQLAAYPELLFPQLYNRLRWLGGTVAERCEEQVGHRRQWLRGIQDPRPDPPEEGSRTLGGHTDSVDTLSLGLDGRLLASGSRDSTIRVWDAITGALRHTLRGHTNRVNAVAWLSRTTFASGDSDGSIMIWDAGAGRIVRVLPGHREAVEALAVSSEGTWLFSGSGDGTIAVWDPTTGRSLRSFDAHAEGVLGLAVARDSSLLASCGRDRTVKVWSLPDLQPLATLAKHTKAVTGVAFTRDARTLVSGSFDQTLIAWEWRAKRVRWTQPPSWEKAHIEGLTSVVISPDDRTVISGGLDCRVVITALASGKTVRTLFAPDDEQGFVKAVAVSGDGNRIYAGCADHRVHIWGRAHHRPLRSLGGHDKSVDALAVTADGARLVSGASDGSLMWWDLSTGHLLRSTKRVFEGISALAVSPDDRTLYAALSAGLEEGPIDVLDVSTGKSLRRLEGHTGEVESLRVSADGAILVSGSWDGTIRVWRTATGALVRTLTGHSNGVRCVLITPAGDELISASVDGTIRRWDLASGARLRLKHAHDGGVEALALSPDGKTLFSVGNDSTQIAVWRLRDMKPIARHEAHAKRLTAIAITPDGSKLVSAAWDGLVKVWSLPAFELVQSFDCDSQGVTSVQISVDGMDVLCGGAGGSIHQRRLGASSRRRAMDGHLGLVHALAFTPDGERLASCSEDRRVRLWSVASGLELQAVEHSGRPMDFGHRLSLTITSDGGALVWAHGTDIVVSSLTSGKSIHELEYHDNTVTSLVTAGRWLASGSLDTKVIVTDLRTGKIERVIEGRGGEIDSVALSPDGSQVIGCHAIPGVVSVWNVASGRIQFRLKADDKAVRAVAVADDEPILFTGSEDGVIRAWSLERRARKRLVRTYRGHERAVRGLVFDGKASRLLSASDDGTLRQWEPVSGESEVLFASDAPLTALAVSRAGGHVACGDAIGRVRIFDRVGG